MGLFVRIDRLEVEPLKLTSEQFPLPLSLRELVRERYADPAVSATAEQAMPLPELLDYLHNTEHLSLPPLEAVLAQTEAIGDPALPGVEQVAALRWLGAALSAWETHYPLEEPLATQVRPLRQLAAALAVTDPDFLRPGAHPLHRLLDAIQASAIGWQPELGRAGQALQRQLTDIVASAMAWFGNQATDLQAICDTLLASAAKDLARVRRMSQRVVETEQGKIKTTNARLAAARMINTALANFRAPEAIGEFLKGPWYASAQLVLLKFGEDSDAWRQMSATTRVLLDSLQPAGEDAEKRRQYIFEIVTQLPKDLKRWLLNLQHDSDAVDDAVGVVEFAHLRVLRQQPLDLVQIEPIAMEDRPEPAGGAEHLAALQGIATGQWFRVETADGAVLRAQLLLKMDREQQLLFTNQAGVKAMQQDYREFARLLTREKAIPLAGGDSSFSLCLAGAAGIRTTEELEALTGEADHAARQAQAERLEHERLEAERREAQREREEKERRLEAERLERERQAAQQRQREREAAEQLEAQRLEAQRRQEEREAAQRLEAERRAREEAERLERERLAARQREREQAERVERERAAAERQARERQAAEQLQREREQAQQQERERLQEERAEAARRERQRREQQELESARRARAQEESRKQTQIDEYLRSKRERLQQQAKQATQAALRPVAGTSMQPRLDLPMGAWLGFHDGDTPLLAKLAVHDREQDHYIFVNREGIKMRQLSRHELLQLMDAGQVDILEASSNFRDRVTRARDQSDE